MAKIPQEKVAIFESMPVPRAVATLAIPTILSQLVTMLYNLADTFFIGQTGDPYQVAAVSVSMPLFIVLTAISNLFGIGGGSQISRLLGKKQPDEAKYVSSFSFYGVIATTAAYCVAIYFAMEPMLRLLGASDFTIGYAMDYILYTTVIGGIPTAVALTLAHLLRSEGGATVSGIGVALGGVLNIAFDPIFITVLNMGVKGAAIATMLSNCVSLGFFVVVLLMRKKKSVLSLNPKRFTLKWSKIKEVLIVGLPACFACLLACLANAFMIKLVSGYGDISVAAMGIVKKLDMIPLNVASGLAQGILPLVAYNYTAENFDRMKKVSRFSRIVGACFALLCVVIFEAFPSQLVRLFIDNAATVAKGAVFLRIACIATPFMTMFFLLNTTLQAMGKGAQSLLIVVLRQGIINIPLLFLMRYLLGENGIVWTQLVCDVLSVAIATLVYFLVLRKERKKKNLSENSL